MNFKIILRAIIPWLTGLLAGAWPVGALILIAIVGCRWRSWVWDRIIILFLGSLAISRGVWYFRVGQFPLISLGEVMLMWAIYQGQYWISLRSSAAQAQAIVWGLVVTLCWSVVQVVHEPLPWILSDKASARLSPNGTTMLMPNDEINSTIQRVLGPRGPGQFKITLETRTEKSSNIRIAIYHSMLPSGGQEIFCPTQTTWTICTINAILPSRDSVVLEIGGRNSWKKMNGNIQLRSLSTTGQMKIELVDLLSNLSRASAWAFNPNALGAGVAAVAVISSISISKYSFSIVLLIATATIWLSGSRAALVTLIVSFLALAFRNRISFKIFLYVGVFIVIAFSLGRFTSTFDLNAESTQQRLIVFGKALTVFRENPLIGTGDFELPVYQQRLGLTHAHNLFLQTLAESGIIGVIPLVGLWLLGFARSIQQRSGEAIIIFGIVLALNLVDYLFYFAPLQFAFWWAFAKVCRRMDQREPKPLNTT